MNTKPFPADITETPADASALAWLAEKEQDLASWLDEVDPELHEEIVCGAGTEWRGEQ